MQKGYDQPLPWGKVLLAILPGLFALGIELRLYPWLFNGNLGQAGRFSEYGLLFLCLSLGVFGFIREGHFAVWSFPALGIVLERILFGAGSSPLMFLVGLGIAGLGGLAIWRGSHIPQVVMERVLLGLLLVGCALYPLAMTLYPNPPMTFSTIWAELTSWLIQLSLGALFLLTLLGIIPGATGWLLARRSDVLAGLILMGCFYVFWEMIGDPEYALLMYTDHQALEAFVAIHPPLFFLIIVPVLVLRSRSRNAQVLSCLLPVWIALISAAAISSMVRPYSLFANLLFWDIVTVMLPLILALIIYGKIAKNTPAEPRLIEAW